MRRMIVAMWMLVAMALGFVSPVLAGEDAPMVAAAADLKFALAEVAGRFEQETGMRVQISFGSSGTARQQIAQGAPYQVFFSADEEYIFALHQEGLTLDQGRVYARGRIVLLVPPASTIPVDAELGGFVQAVRAGSIRHLAIPNPDHAPYGMRAREALRHLGVWEEVQPRLVLGENAVQAIQFVVDGGAEAGIVPLSLALAPPMAKAGRHVLIPEEWHAPLIQRVALLKGAGPVARAFYEYCGTPAAREILRRYGFLTPEASS